MDGSESSGVKVARGHKIEDVRQRLQGEQELIARLRTANVRFNDAQTERNWAIVSAHQAGLSIRRIAGATELSSSRIHRLLTASEAKLHPGDHVREDGAPPEAARFLRDSRSQSSRPPLRRAGLPIRHGPSLSSPLTPRRQEAAVSPLAEGIIGVEDPIIRGYYYSNGRDSGENSRNGGHSPGPDSPE